MTGHVRVDLDGCGEFRFGNALLVGVGYMDTSGADQKGLTPGAVEHRNVGGKGDDGGGETGELTEVNGRMEKDFASFDFVGRGDAGDFGANAGRIGDNPKHDFGTRFIGDDIRSATARDGTDIESGWAKQSIGG